MATKSKSSREVKSDIKRLTGIIERQRQALKSISLDDPEFKQTETAIQKTDAEIKKARAALKESLAAEAKADAEENLASAEEDLKYAKASGDEKQIQEATNAFARARNTAVKAGVKQKSGALLGAETAGGKVGAETTPQEQPTPQATPAGTKTTGTTISGSKTSGTTKTPAAPKTPTKTTAEKQAAAATIAAGTDLGVAEVLLQRVPSLKAILDRYVRGELTDDTFRREIRNDSWYRQNSAEIKKRYVQLYNYQDLVASGQANGSTDYEQQIAKIEASLAKKATAMGSAAANDPAALRKAAENLYITNRSEDESYITDFLAAAIKPIGGMIGGKGTTGYSGDALQNYQALVQTARSNGFEISDILPGGANVDQVLQNIAAGKIDINRVAQDARKLAAQGQPQYVRDLLSQGYNLDQVFAPYRKVMATVLDITDPNEIDLNDPTLRMAITDKGDMNLYDFKKALRQDNRWQYTEQAKTDVSNAAYNVLKDFGFQG